MSTITKKTTLVTRAKALAKEKKIDLISAMRLCQQGGGSEAVSTVGDFMAEIDKTMIERKVGRGAATRIVVDEQPELHAAWLKTKSRREGKR